MCHLHLKLCTPWDDGVYRRLKGLADEYVNGGMERTAANKKAYEELLAEAHNGGNPWKIGRAHV